MTRGRVIGVLVLFAAVLLVACTQDSDAVRARVQTRLARAGSETALSAETPTPAATVEPVRWYAVGNTGGDGVFLRRTPRPNDRLIAWPDGAVMESLFEEQEAEGRHWKKVRDPRGNLGWVPAEYLVVIRQPDASSSGAAPQELQDLYRRVPEAKRARAQLGLDMFLIDFGPAGRVTSRLEAQLFDWYLDAAPGRVTYELRVRAGTSGDGQPVERIWRWDVRTSVLRLAETAPPGAPPFACSRWERMTAQAIRSAAASADGWGPGLNDFPGCGVAAPAAPAPAQPPAPQLPAAVTPGPSTPPGAATPTGTTLAPPPLPPPATATSTSQAGPASTPTAPRIATATP